MLVLSRHVDEEIVITLEDGRLIFIKTIAVSGDRARIGIDAPRSIRVHRRETYERTQQNADTSAA